MTDFTIRSTTIEIMDDLSVDGQMLKRVLNDINRTNRLLRGYAITISAVERLIRGHPKKSYTILDMGCGDGTMLKKVTVWARREG
ncbi:MAG: SAM-dependent methyltransferase, partial [Pricia sp.]|nr:SAM-dependent methyltransferase [Pricia sp.]